MKKYRIAIFASGSGTNAEEIMRFFKDHDAIEVGLLLSNKSDAFALVRATTFGIPTAVFNRGQFKDPNHLIGQLQSKQITHIVLAGFLWLIPEFLVKNYPGRIINIHPALLPAFGGKGMYGMKVHEAVKNSGAIETGITIHEVDEHYDEGKTIFQARCKVEVNDTPEEIASKVHALEYAHYPEVIEKWILKAVV